MAKNQAEGKKGAITLKPRSLMRGLGSGPIGCGNNDEDKQHQHLDFHANQVPARIRGKFSDSPILASSGCRFCRAIPRHSSRAPLSPP